ncbi:MAG: hypothetical protein ACLU4J_17775 [Butyricimonas paravirosa]
MPISWKTCARGLTRIDFKTIEKLFQSSHSLRVAGRGGNMDYKASASFKDTYGVMKWGLQKDYGLNFSLAYHMTNKLTISYQFAFDTDSRILLRSVFNLHRVEPYEPVYDEDGEYIRNYYFNKFDPSRNEKIENPLYNATLSSFSKSKSNRSKSLSRADISKSFRERAIRFEPVGLEEDKYTRRKPYENYTSPEELAQKRGNRQAL